MALLEMGQVSEPLNLHPCKGGHVESGGTVEAHAWAAARNTAQSARDAVCSLVTRSSGPGPCPESGVEGCTPWGGLTWSSQSLDKQAKNSKINLGISGTSITRIVPIYYLKCPVFNKNDKELIIK